MRAIELICELRSQEIVHKNPTVSTLKALAKNNKYGSVRFVIYNDDSVVAADSELFTHQSMAPAMGAWKIRGYVQYLDDDHYAYRSMNVYDPMTKDHPIFRHWEKLGIENGNGKTINEQVNTRDNFKYWYQLIHTNCTDYLNVLKLCNQRLYRGMDDSAGDIFLGTSRKDRRPSDSSIVGQHKFDEYLKQLGFDALRSNSTFTTTHLKVAADYGEPYYIFPFNGSPFTWCENHDDLVLDTDLNDDLYYRFKSIRTLNDFKHTFKMNNTDLLGALKSGNEIWFKGSYVAMRVSVYKEIVG